MERKSKRRRVQARPKRVYINATHTKYSIVRVSAEEVGWKTTKKINKALIFWCDGEGSLEFTKRLQRHQFYNHFPGMWSIAHKVEMVRNLQRMKRIMPQYYDFLPHSFILPLQYSNLKTYFNNKSSRKKKTFIWKPDRGAQGRGIVIFQDPDEIQNEVADAVAQKYLSPLLIDNFKFDLRIYVLVTSVDPLRVYIHDEGMARFCTEEYQKPRSSNLDQAFSHLTNFSLNKKNEHFVKNTDAEQFDKGSKRSMSSVFKQISEKGGNIMQIQDEIDRIVCLTILSVQPFLSSNYHTATVASDGKSRCFEILGFDILIDDHSKPWLLEVNSMPSLSCGSPFDQELKHSVVSGCMKILNISPSFRNQCEQNFKLLSTQREFRQSHFDPCKEAEIAETTNWRMIYPSPNEDRQKILDESLNASKEVPVGAAADNYATRKRREAIMNKLNNGDNQSEPPPFSTQSQIIKPKEIDIKAAIPVERKLSIQNKNKLIKSRPDTAKSTTTIPFSKIRTPAIQQQNYQPNANTNRTPRSVILANKARSNRIQAQEKRSQISEHIPFYKIFEICNKCLIFDSEEKERKRIMQKRNLLIKSTIIPQLISSMVTNVNIQTDKQIEIQLALRNRRVIKMPITPGTARIQCS